MHEKTEPDYKDFEIKKSEGYKLIAVSTDMLFLIKGMNLAFKK